MAARVLRRALLGDSTQIAVRAAARRDSVAAADSTEAAD
jgi:hypothetical protein